MGLTLNSNSLTLESAGGSGGGSSGLNEAQVKTLIKNNTPYQHIGTLEAEDSASLDFEDIPAYTSYKVIFDGLQPTLTSAYARMRVYKTVGTPHTASDYKFNVNYRQGGNGFTNDSSSYFTLAEGYHFQYPLSGELETGRADGQITSFRWSLASGTGTSPNTYDGGGIWTDVAQPVGFTFFPSSNTWARGKVHLYGVNR